MRAQRKPIPSLAEIIILISLFCFSACSKKVDYSIDDPAKTTNAAPAENTTKPILATNATTAVKAGISVVQDGARNNLTGPRATDISNIQARYEEARENAFTAFAHYWLGLDDGTFHTVIKHENDVRADFIEIRKSLAQLQQKEIEITNYLVVSNITEPVFTGRADRRWYNAQTQLFDVRSNMAVLRRQLPQDNTESTDFIGYIQIAGITWGPLEQDNLSEADQLNGIKFRGSLKVNFRVFRFFTEKGLTDWADVTADQDKFFEAFGRGMSRLPRNLSQRLNLYFKILQRDRHWFVSTPGGDKFVNGKLVEEVNEWKNEKPNEAYAKEVERKASFTRDSYTDQGINAQISPAVLDASTTNTMNLLRGRPLVK